MDKESRQLIEQLAGKLGTTTEYLWGVMIRQAPIYAFSTLLEMCIVAALGVILFKVHKKFSLSRGDNIYNNLYDKYEAALFIMVIGTIIWSILFIISICLISQVITAIANPEYWALMKILDKIN